MYYIGLKLVPAPAPEKTLKHLLNDLLQNAITAKNCRISGNSHPTVGLIITSVYARIGNRAIEIMDCACPLLAMAKPSCVYQYIVVQSGSV
jgi:hypothetical protein